MHLEIDYCEFPEDLQYDLENNVWVRFEKTERVRVGITSVHAAIAGKLTRVKFKAKGSMLQRGQSIATIESARYFGAARTPLSGTLVDVNHELETNARLASDFPYNLGWIALIEPILQPQEKALLVDARSAQDRIRSMIHELRIRCFKAFPDYDMWEVGVECSAVLVRLGEFMQRISINDVVHVVSDDPTADIEMVRWSEETGQDLLESRKEGNLMHFIVRRVK